MKRQLVPSTTTRKITNNTTDKKLPGCPEIQFLKMKNSKKFLDSTNHSLVLMKSEKLKTGFHSLKRKQKLKQKKLQLKKLKKYKKLKKPKKLKPKLKLRPKLRLKKRLKNKLKLFNLN